MPQRWTCDEVKGAASRRAAVEAATPKVRARSLFFDYEFVCREKIMSTGVIDSRLRHSVERVTPLPEPDHYLHVDVWSRNARVCRRKIERNLFVTRCANILHSWRSASAGRSVEGYWDRIDRSGEASRHPREDLVHALRS